jgi:hypothetical protein
MFTALILCMSLIFSLVLIINVVFTVVAAKEQSDTSYLTRWIVVMLVAANWAYFYYLTH